MHRFPFARFRIAQIGFALFTFALFTFALFAFVLFAFAWTVTSFVGSDHVLTAAEPVDIRWDQLRDIRQEPIVSGDAALRVVCFLGTECPLARLYAPRLRRLEEEFAPQGARFLSINSNRQDSLADIRLYRQELALSFPCIKDEDQRLAKEFGATRTPEVFVLDQSGTIRYQGRIDNQYEPGIMRPAPTQHELRDAITALLDGKSVPTARTDAVGCLITFASDANGTDDLSASVTFSSDVAPILNRYCVECHRDGEIGPFALTDYDEVIGWGDMMLEVIEQNRMPPWHADPRFGHYVGARSMSTDDRETLAAWVEQGMPLGNKSDLPPQPEWATGWHLDTLPDVEFVMRERPFVVPAEGTVEYQYFVVDTGWKEDRWIRAAQVIPGDASVVHHTIVFVRPPDGTDSEGLGWMGGYVPGQRTPMLPDGYARRIPAGSKLVFQMHYTPIGRPVEDITKVGVWFSDSQKVTHEVTTRVALNQHFEIPPEAEDFAVELRLDRFERQSQLLGLMPHMHLRGKSFQLKVRRHDREEILLLVPAYDFNWQHWYQLEAPLSLDDVESFEMEVHFDNSSRNPTNPDPDEYVTWGDQTWQEMAVAFFDIAHPRDQPRVIAQPTTRIDPIDIEKRQHRIKEATRKFLLALDRNGDGIVEREETPDAFRRFGFRDIDQNGDGRLDRSEIEEQAASRF